MTIRENVRLLGRLGPAVPAVGLGCNNFGSRLDLAQCDELVSVALGLGVNFFDTADIYGDPSGTSELFLGEVVRKRRNQIFLATKFGFPMETEGGGGASPQYILRAVEASLRRLKTDWIDLYQLHRPDPQVPIEQTLLALDRLVQAGKVRHVGCSNLTSEQLDEARMKALELGVSGFVSCQDEYSLVVRKHEDGLFGNIWRSGLGLIVYRPLAGGLLTGKYKRGAALPVDARLTNIPALGKRYLTETNWQIIAALEDFCTQRKRTVLEAALGWLLAKPFVSTVLVGAKTPGQLRACVEALDWRPTSAHLVELDRISGPAKSAA